MRLDLGDTFRELKWNTRKGSKCDDFVTGCVTAVCCHVHVHVHCLTLFRTLKDEEKR